MRQLIRRLLIIALSLSILLYYSWSSTVSQGSVVLAHTFVIGSDPVDGSTIKTAPRVVRIFFDAPISPASSAHIYTPDEHIADAARSSISSTNPRELDTPLLPPAQLPQGGYTVRWTALASIDGHTTQGVIGFNIGHSSTGLPGQTILGPSTSNKLPELDLIGSLAVAWEWLVLMALTFWVGILITEGLLLAGLGRTTTLFAHTSRQTRPLQWLCLATLLVGEIITFILRTSQLTQALNGGGIDFMAAGQILSGTIYGYLWLLRMALMLGALGLLWWTTRQGDNANRTGQSKGTRQAESGFRQMRQRVTQEYSPVKEELVEEDHAPPIPASSWPYTVLWLVLAGLILFTLALSGDAAALAQPHISAIVLDWLYLTARCIWLGTVAYLGYVLLPLLPIAEPDRYTEVLATLLRRLHPLMLGALGVLLVSGLYLAEASLSNAQQLISDPYGRTLLVEYILVASMILLSAYALFMLHPALARQAVLLPVVNAEMPARRTRQSALEQRARRLKQAFNLQSWLGAGVLFCAALMSFFAPPIVFPAINYAQSTNATAAVTTPTTQTVQTQQVGNLAITLQVLPGRVDYAHTVIVTMQDNRSGNFISDAQVQMSINMQIMNMGTSHATVKGGNPTYIATFGKDTAFAMFGTWVINLNIQRPHQAALATTFMVTLGGA